MKTLRAQTIAELKLTLTRGESILLSLGIPVVALIVFSKFHVLNTGTSAPVAFLTPGIIALAIMSSALVNLSIATGFERYYGILKRLGTTPLGRARLVSAKVLSLVVLEIIQTLVLILVAHTMGWHPHHIVSKTGVSSIGLSQISQVVLAVIVATVGFAGFGMFIAGNMSAFLILGFSNLLWFVLMMMSGIFFPLTKLPHLLVHIVELLPSTALGEILHSNLGGSITTYSDALEPWTVMIVWALAGLFLASRFFRWEQT